MRIVELVLDVIFQNMGRHLVHYNVIEQISRNQKTYPHHAL
jgi:hypothetical protein